MPKTRPCNKSQKLSDIEKEWGYKLRNKRRPCPFAGVNVCTVLHAKLPRYRNALRKYANLHGYHNINATPWEAKLIMESLPSENTAWGTQYLPNTACFIKLPFEDFGVYAQDILDIARFLYSSGQSKSLQAAIKHVVTMNKNELITLKVAITLSAHRESYVNLSSF